MRHPDGGKDDSFWIRMNEGDWIKWNGIANDLPDDIFLWVDYGADFNLDTGNSKLEIGYRETDARLDMICLASQGVTPDISVSPAGGLSVMTDRK